ncbi:MAG: hypothetical protein AVDCRST_MAG29-1720, partial [uncultured Nocardioidaceae bacterium]
GVVPGGRRHPPTRRAPVTKRAVHKVDRGAAGALPSNRPGRGL